MKRETFIKAIDAIVKQNEKDEAFACSLKPFFDGNFVVTSSGIAMSALLKVLIEEMEDTYDEISWWLYDAPNEDRSKPCIWEDGVGIALPDAGALYDYLERNRSKI